MILLNTDDLTLTDVIDVEVLVDVQRKLANLVGISVVTADAKGKPVGTLNNFSPFCQLIRSSKIGNERCIKCDALAEKRAYERRKPIIDDCHMGLKDCCVPIIVEDKLLGGVLGGQVLVEGEDDPKEKFDIPQIAEDLDLDEADLKAAIEEIKVVDPQYLKDCIDFYVVLANFFTEMGIKSLTQQLLLEETQKKLDYERRLKIAKLKTVEAQVNPHFLFNTLNSIARVAMLEDATETEELIYNLSDLLRYNLKQSEEFPMIRNEIKNIKRYLSIQKVRYGDRLNYEINIPEQVMDYCIPSMILQPIVENSIIHGIEPVADGGSIEISAKKVNDNIFILIKDTGVGFNKLKALQIISGNESESKNGIGFKNTHLRLQNYFGENFGLNILDDPSYSTTIEISLPAFTNYQQYKEKVSI